jgi:uncharacterized protein
MPLSEIKDTDEKSSRVPELIRVSLLYDFYGVLLSEKQKEAIEKYYLEDQTLGEIAKAQNVSRQAVFDALQHAIATLEEYESKLALVQQHQTENKNYMEIVTALRKMIREIDNAGIIYDSDKLVDLLKSLDKKVSGWIQEKEDNLKEDHV